MLVNIIFGSAITEIRTLPSAVTWEQLPYSTDGTTQSLHVGTSVLLHCTKKKC